MKKIVDSFVFSLKISIRAELSIDLSLTDAVVQSVFYLEGVQELYLPLPEKGFVTSFECKGDSFQFSGKVEGRARAQQIFDEAIENSNDAILIQYHDEGMIHLRFNVAEPVVVTIMSIAPLTKNGLQIPFSTTNRYGDPGVFEWNNLPTKIVSVVSVVPVTIFHGEEKTSWPVTLDCQKPLFFVLELKNIPLMVNAFPTPDDKFFVLAEGVVESNTMVEKRRIFFVVDCSGSMFAEENGWRIEGARIGVETALLQLTEGDEFNIMLFGSGHQTIFKEFVPFNDENLATVRTTLCNLPDLGGTDLFDALSATLGLPAHNILLISDGDIGSASKLAQELTMPLAPVFILGIGLSNNKTFFSNFAEQTKGVTTFANSKQAVVVATNTLIKKCGMSSSSYLTIGQEKTIVFPDFPVLLGSFVPSVEQLKIELDGKAYPVTVNLCKDGKIAQQRWISRILQLSNYQTFSEDENQRLTDLAIEHNIVCHLTSLAGVAENSRPCEERMVDFSANIPIELQNLTMNNVENIYYRGEVVLAQNFCQAGYVTEMSGTTKYYRKSNWGKLLLCLFCCPCVAGYHCYETIEENQRTNTNNILVAEPERLVKPEEDDLDLLNKILSKMNSKKNFVVDKELQNLLRSLGLDSFDEASIWKFIQKRFSNQKEIWEHLV